MGGAFDQLRIQSRHVIGGAGGGGGGGRGVGRREIDKLLRRRRGGGGGRGRRGRGGGSVGVEEELPGKVLNEQLKGPVRLPYVARVEELTMKRTNQNTAFNRGRNVKKFLTRFNSKQYLIFFSNELKRVKKILTLFKHFVGS